MTDLNALLDEMKEGLKTSIVQKPRTKAVSDSYRKKRKKKNKTQRRARRLNKKRA